MLNVERKAHWMLQEFTQEVHFFFHLDTLLTIVITSALYFDTQFIISLPYSAFSIIDQARSDHPQ